MSEDRTIGGAPPDADAADAPGTQAGSDADATRAYAVSPARADATVESLSGRAEPSTGPTPAGSRPPDEADDARWGRTADARAGAPTTVLPHGASRPARPTPPRPDRPAGEPRPAARAQARPAGRRRARLVLQRVDAWSVFLFSLVASICLGVVLFVAVTALYAALSSLGVLGSLNGLLGEVAGSGTDEQVVEPFITSGRVLGATAVLAAVDVVLLTALATLGALLYNLCASLTGGIEVQLGERE